ncbi:unnamed protein product [Lactuca saligna]|uniref:Uncharacterized protein n=1 Tax=Lactuca saligna TaxID=75948 RepID=A0AA35YDV3_LACSI|nr:unnamed protein product [Lactuca saligna]
MTKFRLRRRLDGGCAMVDDGGWQKTMNENSGQEDRRRSSGFTFFDSFFIETGLSLEELIWKFYEKSVDVGPPLSVEVSNSLPMAMEANLVRVPVGNANRPFFPLSSDAAALADSLPCEGVGPHPHSDRRSSPLMVD